MSRIGDIVIDKMIKKGNENRKVIDSAKRARLIREGNRLLSEGEIVSAEKIFVTTDYKDGLVRLGDYYLEKKDLYKCAQMYFLSENKSKIDAFCKKSAVIIAKFLKSDNEYDKIMVKK